MAEEYILKENPDGTKITVHDVQQVLLVILKDIDAICRRHNISLSRVYRSDGIDTNMSMVRSGVGVVLGPASFARHYNVAAVPLVPETEASLRFICLKSLLQRKEIRELRDHLVRICREHKLLNGGDREA